MEGTRQQNEERKSIKQQSNIEKSEECIEEDEAANGPQVQCKQVAERGQVGAMLINSVNIEEQGAAQGTKSQA